MSLGPYEAAPHLMKYASLYHAVALSSGGAIGPDTVDRWESWQAAAYLGVGLPLPDEAQPGAAVPGRDLVRENAEWHQARIEAEKAGLPAPPPPAPAAPDPRTAELLSTFEGMRGA